MPTVIEYQSSAALANATRWEGNGDGVAEAFGEISNATATHPAHDYHVHFKVPVATAATGDVFYELYLVQSLDGVDWTDGIDPASSGDVASSLVEARLIDTMNANGTASGPSFAEKQISMIEVVGTIPPYFGFVHLNNSGQTVPTGTDTVADYVAVNYATA